MLDDEWFEDDIAARFKEFLKVSFGEKSLEKNLAFIEECLGRDIRSYFVKEFYKEHISRYKKRPIYWMFSSPKGSFNALIYMHRYTPDTINVLLNGYLREYQEKLRARKAHFEQVYQSADAPPAEKTKAQKQIDYIEKTLRELAGYERDVIYPLATKRIAINLDDGVLVNYNKFGGALRKVPGMSETE